MSSPTDTPIRDSSDNHTTKTTLRAITYERPANSIFRDLLLKADDAGATSFELILDSRNYPTGQVVHPALAEFQGPSLLACDNSVLVPSSFESISRTGNLLGLPGRDLAGRDLESVDNLVDFPSVLSGSKLLVLDPELGWSTDRVGRPTYDFIEKSDRPETRDQAEFGAVQHNYNNSLEGKIIRIPLRTDEQTVGAVDKFITEADIRSAFSEFREEMVESLLFLKNIVSITLRIVTEEGVYAKAEVVGTQDGTSGRSSVAAALHEIFVDQSRLDFDTSFPVTIHYCGRGQNDSTSEWEIFHHARSQLGVDEELTKWGETQGLVPWVGLAALVRAEGFGREETDFCGRLFTRLPLLIHTHQPVHIHGMFSPTPDRASIYHVRDRMVLEDSDMDQCSRWNKKLSEECLTFAWSRFLLSLTSTGVIGDRFRYWPRNMDRNLRSGDWTSFMEVFLEMVVRTELPVWPTYQGWLSVNKVFFALGGDRGINVNIRGSHLDVQDTMHALERVGMPVTCPPSEIYGDTKKCFERAEERLLTPITAARFLRIASEKLARASQDVRQRLLEYLLSESSQTGYVHLDGIALFPMCDGSFAASGTLLPPILMLPMDENEMKLFSLRPHMTVNVRNIGANSLRRLRQDIKKIETETSLKQWGLEDVYEYCMATYFSEINPYVTSDIVEARDICGLEREFAKNLASLWDWIISRMPEDASIIPLLSQLGGLWLIPIMGGNYRRVSPTSKQLLLDPSSREELGSFLKSVCEAKVDAYWTNQLYHSDLMSVSTTQFFRKRGIVQFCDDLENLMDWLENRPRFVPLFCSRERNELVRFLQMLSADFLRSGNSSGKLLCQLRKLPVFEEIRNNSKGTSLNWTNLEREGVTKYVAVTMESVVPELDGIVFLNARNPSMLWLLGQFALAEVPDMRQLLDEYVFSGILLQTMYGILERLAIFALDNIDFFPAGGVAKMADMQFVPVQSRTDCGVVTRRLKTPRQCVDPRSGLGDLFFAHESVWIDDRFWKAYSGKLAGMKLIDKITVELVFDRVKAYSNAPRGADTNELARKVKMLIITSTELEIPSLRSSDGKPWLPARKYPNETIVMANPEDCRDKSFTGLVGYAMPIVPFTVGITWSKALGWDGLIPSVAIQKHLQILVDRREFSGLRTVLDYLDKNSQVKGYLDGIREMKWIVGVSGEIFKCEDIFFNHAARLSPSCDCIDNGLGERYKLFFTLLGVQDSPSLPRLKRLIDDLDRGGTLDRSHLGLVINAILLATELYPQEDFTKFKAPDYTNTLRDISTLTSGKPEYCETELFFLHPGISQQSISVLGIPTLGQRQLDVVETHSYQGLESAETRMAVIKNTMKRFPVECTFNTYLRNAENSGTATKVGWVLDSIGGWEKTSILTEELSDTMGPALLCWSDGVLEEKDLSQLFSFGGGTKSSEMEGMGSVNTGKLAMYHWSSVPQIISRDYLVILDPEEKYLPLNRHTKRRHVGMKISLQKMQKQYTDHLKPFYGVLGFGPESEFLEGTIFRLPFRKPGSGSGLVPDNLIIDADSAQVLMVNYFAEAKRSLLFLARITTVEFRIKDMNSPEWKISVTRGLAEVIILDGTVEQIFIESRQRSSTPSMANDEWRLARRKVSDASASKNLKATQKEHDLNTQCGIAALVSHQYAGSGFDGQFFSSLPFTWSSMLPVHIQASFIFTDGEGSSSPDEGVQDTGSEWNAWILEHGVVDLYLDFLEYLSNAFGELSFKFWPPHEGASGSLSNKLGKVFWRKVSGCDLKLFSVEENKPKTSILDLSPVGVNQGPTRETQSLTEVIFDFLEPEYSNILRALLDRLGVKNIVSPTEVMSKALQDQEGITKIDPPYISSLLRGNPKSDVLHDIWAADDYSFDRLEPFLKFMMKGPSSSSDILTGCRILPLADLTLGTLRNSCIHGVSNYYIAQRGTLSLFDYAPGLVVHPDVSQATANIILKLGLNVSILPPSDFPRLFANVNESDQISRRLHCFLLKFWFAVRYEYEGRHKVVLSNLPVYSATVNGRLQAISPDEFESLPAIISPDDEGELAICSKLPTLYLVDRRTVSTATQKTEQLSTSVGLMRFITSLGKLAKLKHKTTEAFFLLFLEQEHIMLLRRLVKRVVTKQVLIDHSSATLILKSLPLWPTMSGKLVSAVDALLAPDPRFCVSWIESQERFIDPGTSQGFSSVLQLLGVNRLKASEFISSYFRSTRDRELLPAALKNYRNFIEAYIEYIGVIPSDCALALDGNCCFRLPRDLYDHSEGIFIAAFRGAEKRCFLHPDLRHLKDWYTPGLRSVISGSHYYECATFINKRVGFSGPRIQLELDAATVFRYLRTNQSFICERWSAEDLRRIQGVQFVPLLRHLAGQPRHRRDGMSKISSIRTFGSLEDSVNSEYLDVCWSQCPIYAKPPGDYVLQQVLSKGIPSLQVVFRHIEYLAVHRNEVRSLHDIQLYIKDILASYRFLDNHYGETNYISEKAQDTDSRALDTVMWLNMDEPIDSNFGLFETSWVSARNLCLGIDYDFSHYRYVRSTLASYGNLLTALEVTKIQKPKLETATLDLSQRKSACEKLFSFWQQGKLCDVELVVGGVIFKAHRIVLASGSSYWENVLIGGWRDAGERGISIKETAAHTVSAMLHFLYTGELPLLPTDKIAGENLEHIMDWLVAADQWDMTIFKSHIEEMVIQRDYVRPENVRWVLGIAREAQAKALSNCCEAYIKENQKVIERIDYPVT